MDTESVRKVVVVMLGSRRICDLLELIRILSVRVDMESFKAAISFSTYAQ